MVIKVIKFVIFELQIKLNKNDKKMTFPWQQTFFILVTVYFYDLIFI